MYTSFEQIKSNPFNPPRLSTEEYYRSLWANDRRIPAFEYKDGRKVASDLNWFRRITEFYVNAMWNLPPYIDPLKGITISKLADEMEKATRWRSIKGLGVVSFLDDGTVRAVDTSHYFPVVDETDYSMVTGHMIVYPWCTDDKQVRFIDDKGFGTNAPSLIRHNLGRINRIDVIEVVNGQSADRKTYTFNGNQIGTLLKTVPTKVVAVCTFGDWISDYVDVAGPILRLENRLFRLDNVLNRHSSPHLQGPPDILDKTSDNNDLVIDEDGMFFPKADGGEGYDYITYDPNGGTVAQMIEELKEFIFVASGLTPAAFGLDPSDASGVARERQMLVALQKIRKMKRGTDQCLIEGFGYQGYSDVIIDWPEDPFARYNEMVQNYLELHREGIYTTDEVKDMIEGLSVRF